MKFTKFGKALLMSALTAGVIFGVSSCIQTYSVGYLYVTTTVTAQPSGEGLITGYKIEHNTGGLTKINGLPISTGGANPIRAVLTQASRFVYVLNRGANSAGNGNCTTANPCLSPNITLFAVGGNGILTPQQTYYTQGNNPFRIAVDSSGSYLMVLDHDAPSSAGCQAALGSGVTSCGDITVFQINGTTGRLSLVQNQQVLIAGVPLTYFPVPANPVDFLLTASNVLTLTSSTAQTSFPYTGGSQVFPYTYNGSTGQLTLSLSTPQSLGIAQGNAIVNGSGTVYVLDNEPITYTSSGTTTTAASQILPFTVGTNGSLQAQTGGIVPDDPTMANPTQLLVESKGKFVYLANQGNNTTGNNPNSGIAAYLLNTSPSYQLTFIPGEPFGSGSGPQCIVEDPSDQYVFTANQYDSTVTGRVLDPNSGVLNNMRVSSSYVLPGPASWCFIDGRTN
jgi:hypothetical protein